MCHMSPTAQILGLLVTIITTIFTVWHIWCFDRGRCMLFSRKNLFRWAILMMLTAALCCLVIWSGMLTWVKYHEYYAVVPHGDGTMIRPVPFQLWSPERQNFIRGAYHVASIGWGLLAAVHAEETLYWAYLIGSIRKRDSKSWFSSVHFKIWVGCVISAMSIAPGAGFIETEDLNEMEHYIFFVGATFAVILFVASIWLLLVFPTFIAESRRRGANPEVLARLQYFKELNTARTVFRFFYALCLLTLSIDAFTEHKAVNASPFWTDVLFILAYFCALTSTAIAIMILLPRSMANESGAPKTTALYVNPPPQLSSSPYAHHPYTKQNDPDHQSDTDVSVSADGTTLAPPRRASFGVSVRSSMPFNNEPLSPWGALGERLNIGHEKMGWAEGDMEMAGGRSPGGGGGGGSYGMSSGPFAAQPGSTVVRPGEEVHSVPRQLNEFRGPLDVEPREPVDLSKILVTSETVVEKHY